MQDPTNGAESDEQVPARSGLRRLSSVCWALALAVPVFGCVALIPIMILVSYLFPPKPLAVADPRPPVPPRQVNIYGWPVFAPVDARMGGARRIENYEPEGYAVKGERLGVNLMATQVQRRDGVPIGGKEACTVLTAITEQIYWGSDTDGAVPETSGHEYTVELRNGMLLVKRVVYAPVLSLDTALVDVEPEE